MDILATTTFNKRKHQLKRKMIDTYISFRHIRTEPSMFVQEVILFIWLVCLFSCLLAACYLDGIFFSSCKCACQRAVNKSWTREPEKKSNEIVVFVLNLEMVWVDLVTYTLSKSIFGCLENRRGFISNLAGVTSALAFCRIHIALFLILNELILSMEHNVMHGILSNIDNHQSECLSKCLVIDESRIQH